MKEFHLLQAEPIQEKQELFDSRVKKLRVLLSDIFDYINWMCFLINAKKIKDETLMKGFKSQIIYYYELLKETMPDQASDETTYKSFKALYRKLKEEKNTSV
jgi:hypothetical protein